MPRDALSFDGGLWALRALERRLSGQALGGAAGQDLDSISAAPSRGCAPRAGTWVEPGWGGHRPRPHLAPSLVGGALHTAPWSCGLGAAFAAGTRLRRATCEALREAPDEQVARD